MATTNPLIVLRRFVPTAFLALFCVFGFSQKRRTLEELINTKEPGWALVEEWIKAAKNPVEVLAKDQKRAEEALVKTQVTTRSPMGAIVYMTGGILIDSGWIRILGSGSDRLPRNIMDWNKGKSFTEYGQQPSFLLIADDALGGFFAINGGGLGKDPGAVYYMSPDNLEWESLWKNYSEFLQFCFSGDISKFYGDYRWKGWRKEVDTLPGDRAFHFFPPLWSKEGKKIEKDVRGTVPVQELFDFALETRRQLGISK